MTYILIVMWMGILSYDSGKASLSVEFNDLKSCQAAAKEIRKQSSPDVIICAAKGNP